MTPGKLTRDIVAGGMRQLLDDARTDDRLADMRPYVTALLTPLQAVQLPVFADLLPDGAAIKLACPHCPGVRVSVTRSKRGWALKHPTPYCGPFARYDEAR